MVISHMFDLFLFLYINAKHLAQNHISSLTQLKVDLIDQ